MKARVREHTNYDSFDLDAARRIGRKKSIQIACVHGSPLVTSKYQLQTSWKHYGQIDRGISQFSNNPIKESLLFSSKFPLKIRASVH
jgi:hypothetical protein